MGQAVGGLGFHVDEPMPTDKGMGSSTCHAVRRDVGMRTIWWFAKWPLRGVHCFGGGTLPQKSESHSAFPALASTTSLP